MPGEAGFEGIENGVYYPESDPYTKVLVYGNYTTTGCTVWFEVHTKDGMKYLYGQGTGKQTFPKGVFNTPNINAWYLERVTDPHGNYMVFNYVSYDYFPYLTEIVYGNNLTQSFAYPSTVTLTYDTRTDQTPFKIESVQGKMGKRLAKIVSKTGNDVFREYDLQYDNTDHFSRLISITQKNGAGESLKPTTLQWTHLPVFSQQCILPNVIDAPVYPSVSIENQTYLSADINGDGLTDLIGIFPHTEYGEQWTHTTKVCFYLASLNDNGEIEFSHANYQTIRSSFNTDIVKHILGGSVIGDYNGDGKNEVFLTTYVENGPDRQAAFYGFSWEQIVTIDHELTGNSNEPPLFALADFNNDGKSDIISIEKGPTGTNYICRIKFEENPEWLILQVPLKSQPRHMFTADFDNNGLIDVMFLDNEGYHIYWNQGNGTDIPFNENNRTSRSNLTDNWMVRMGDFNGDGLPDFITNATHSDQWYFALNNGDGTFTKQLACTLEIYDQSFTSYDDPRFNCHVFDFDLDGKSDVVITKAMYKRETNMWGQEWGEFRKTYTYWMRSTGSFLALSAPATSDNDHDAENRFIISGDFDGDGRIELMNYGYNCYNAVSTDRLWRIYKNSRLNTNSGMLTAVTDGFGNKTSISYSPLTDKTIYTRGNDSRYPVMDIAPPIPAVVSVTADNGVANATKINYKYAGAKAHLKGKGFLGLASMTSVNSTMGVTTESGITKYNQQYFVPEESYTKTIVGNNTAGTNTKFSFIAKNNGTFFAYPHIITKTDLDRNTNITTCFYESDYGNITKDSTFFGNNMYRVVLYGDYVMSGGTVPAQPQLITVKQKHADDETVFTNKTRLLRYQANGDITTKVENFGTGKPLTSQYTYDLVGNVLTKKVSGNGVATITTHYEYDHTKRFVLKEYTSPESYVQTFTYDNKWNLETETDETVTTNKLTTRHGYDNWGRRTSTTLPDGRKIGYDTGWGSDKSKRYYTLTQTTGEPWVKTWYDQVGREVLTESIGQGNTSLGLLNAYNTKGQLTLEAKTVGELTTAEIFHYDNRGRITKWIDWNRFYLEPDQSIDYDYGNRTVTTTTNGKITIKTYDAWAGLVSVSDPGSEVKYNYGSIGKPTSITVEKSGGPAAERAVFSMTYDDVGNLQTLSDPNAGNFTYTYDALGRLTEQTGANGTTSNTYDELGRLSYSTLNAETTNYTYYTSGSSIHLLQRVQTGSNSVEYTYDQCGRPLTETRNIAGTGVGFTFAYNNAGLLQTTTYPEGLTVKNEYDPYGNLAKVSAGSQAIWELTGATFTETATRLGGAMAATAQYNEQGGLTRLKTQKGTTMLRDLGYDFNVATGNLNYRTGMLGLKETFTYDAADRLEYVKHGEDETEVMRMFYDTKGNITSKTGLGQYDYHPDKPHAVEYIDNTGGLISSRGQAITYTAFQKATNLKDTVGADAWELDIFYGPDRQRWKSELKKNEALTKTTIFAGDYEKIIENGVTKQLYYISGGDGLAAVYVKQSGQSDQIYYAHTDHLGSILSLTNADGAPVFKATYDAWGKQTLDPANTFKFHRGYTGHEHLPEFSLINMNGRMYDPIVGRFLSPDPYVQAPDFSQSFNRYSYVLNNPLIYTDPDGEWGWLAAGMGFVYGYVSYGLMNGDWGWKAAGNGALTGVMWGVGYTGQVESAGISQLSYAGQSAITSTVNSFMPSQSIPITDNFSVNTSFGLGISPGGLVAGVNLSGTYHNGDWALTGGIGASSNSSSWGVSAMYKGYGVSHYRTTFGNGTGPDGKPNNQLVGAWGLHFNYNSIRVENDKFGDKGDRWRTSAVEVNVGNFVFGKHVYTNEPDGKNIDPAYTSRFWDRLGFNATKEAYADGRVFSSPLYIGIKRDGMVTRIGINHPMVQDATQNGWHLFGSKGSPFFPTPYKGHDDYYFWAYRYSGYYNPYSLYYR